jgi:hypothetical protein
MRTRSSCLLHRSAPLIFTNETVLTEGERMLSVQLAGADVASKPAASRARFTLKHVSWWMPTPLTATAVPALGYQRAGARSIEQAIPITPLGPAAAVACTYCVPSVVGASVGPESEIVGRWLSTWIVLVCLTEAPAPSMAVMVSGSAPRPY